MPQRYKQGFNIQWRECLLLLLLVCLNFDVGAQGRVGLPRKALREGILLKHKAYCAHYNPQTRCPDWVAWLLTKERAGGKEPRINKFSPDPLLKGGGATHADYTHSGYDRGHMCPAADNGNDAACMKESFYTSNICPQKPTLNRGVWKQLEEKLRRLARSGNLCHIVCGPIFDCEQKTTVIGQSAVAVPHRFFKVVYINNGNRHNAVAYLFTQGTAQTKPQSCIVTVDSVEALTGWDFFPDLPDEIEQKIEAQTGFLQ